MNIHLCLVEISSAVGRTFITTFGLFLGVSSLLINLAFVRGMDDDLQTNMTQIGGLNIIEVQKITPKTPEQIKSFQRSPGLSFTSVKNAASTIPAISSILCLRELGSFPISGSGHGTKSILIAADSKYLQTFNYKLSQGQSFTEANNFTNVCLIGERIAATLFPHSSPIGEQVTIQRLTLTVIGIIASKSIRSRRDSECCIPYSFYRSSLSERNPPLSSVSVLLNTTENIRHTCDQLTCHLTAQHRGVRDFTIETNASRIREMKTTSTVMKVLLWGIAIISLLVGGISIMNIMFATISNRIREIGLRMALGAHNYDIFIQFLLEAILVSCIGGLPGLFLGITISFIPEGYFPFHPRLTGLDFILAIAFTISVGMLSGLIPAIRASRLQPIEALRI